MGLVSELEAIVGSAHVLTGSMAAGYCIDWTRRYSGETPAVVRPGSVEEIVALVQWARETRTGLVPQGGNTGLVGGGVPRSGEVVVSLVRLDDVNELDADGGQLTAGAGATVAAVQAAASTIGWRYGVDFAARDSATIGGSIATNAGGLRVLRHGATRAQVLGVEAVLGTGEVVSDLRGLVKNNTGYELAQLLCGSEGTLGFVTAARLRLVAPAADTVTALVGFDSVAAAFAATGVLRRAVPNLEAAELMVDAGMALVAEHLGIGLPFAGRHGAYLLVEAVGPPDPTDALATALDSIMDVQAIAVGNDSRSSAALWRYREAHTEAISTVGVPRKLDVTLPGDRFVRFCSEAVELVSSVDAGAQTWLFGHVGDGNVHVNVTGSNNDGVDDAVLGLVVALGGSISAEHGIGVAKRQWLSRSAGTSTVGAMRAIKGALDPGGVCNPGVLLPEELA